MAEERVQRRLAAILAADVVGYSRMMRDDEPLIIAQIKSLRDELIGPTFADYGGRIFKTIGDGFLTVFSSAVDTVQCAIEIQDAMDARHIDLPVDRQFKLRIGITLGDVPITCMSTAEQKGAIGRRQN